LTDYRKIISSHAIPLLIAAMWAGMLWSRALLSVSMILFLLAAFLSRPREDHARHIRRHPFLMLMPILFIAPLLTGPWSTDTAQWLRVLQNKLPLLLLPLLSLPLFNLDRAIRRRLCYWMGGSIALSMARTCLYYFNHLEQSTTGYLQAKVLPVDMGNDHVRYAWLLIVIFSWGLHLCSLTTNISVAGDRKWLFALLIAIFAFQHLLASKTGLLGTYLVLVFYVLMHRRKPRIRMAAWLLLLIPIAAWAILPTFRNRLRFVLWDFQHYSRGAYTEGLSDAPRVISVRAGWDTWKKYPLSGCGFGDLRSEITEWYTRKAPALKGYEQILPSNEFVLHAAAGGLIAFLIFCIAVLGPFFIRGMRHSFAWLCFHGIALMGFLYEIGLETQFGVFIYAFLGCWIYATLRGCSGVKAGEPAGAAGVSHI
jgi:O-antigen ligase